MICIYTYPIHQPDIIISLNNVWIVINRTDSIYTFIQFAYDFIQPNSTTRSFPKKEKKPVSREEEKKTRNWQSLFWKKKKKEKKKKKRQEKQRNDTDSITIVLETGVQSRDGKKEKTMESERRA